MKIKARIILSAFILFIFYVSFKILEPEIKETNPKNPPREFPDEIELPQKKNLPPAVVWVKDGKHNQTTVAIIEWLVSRYQLDWNRELSTSPWKIAAGWVKPREIHPDHAPQMGKY